MEAKPALGVEDVHPVEDQGVEVHVQPQRGVRALDEGHSADLRVLDRAQTELALGSPSKRATHRAHERREHGDKVVLARRMLVDKFTLDPAAVEAMAKTEVVPRLAELLGTDTDGVRGVLWEAYDPQSMWLVFTLIGASSMVCLMLYGKLVKVLPAEKDWAFAGLALAYTWAVHDQHSFTSFPKYTVGFGVGLGLYFVVRKLKPEWIPEGARASG